MQLYHDSISVASVKSNGSFRHMSQSAKLKSLGAPLSGVGSVRSFDSYFDPSSFSSDYSWNYLLQPCDIFVQARYVAKPHQVDLTVSANLYLSIGSELPVEFCMNDRQFWYIKGLSNYISSYAIYDKYRKWRPKSQVKEDPVNWWKYVIRCVLTDVHEKYRKLSWSYLLERRKNRNQYVKLYKRAQTVYDLPPDKVVSLSETESNQMRSLEENFGLDDLLHFRSYALAELRLEHPVIAPKASEKNVDVIDSYLKELSAADKRKTASSSVDNGEMKLTEEERQQLYEIVGSMQGEARAKEETDPEDILTEISVKIPQLCFTLCQSQNEVSFSSISQSLGTANGNSNRKRRKRQVRVQSRSGARIVSNSILLPMESERGKERERKKASTWSENEELIVLRVELLGLDISSQQRRDGHLMASVYLDNMDLFDPCMPAGHHGSLMHYCRVNSYNDVPRGSSLYKDIPYNEIISQANYFVFFRKYLEHFDLELAGDFSVAVFEFLFNITGGMKTTPSVQSNLIQARAKDIFSKFLEEPQELNIELPTAELDKVRNALEKPSLHIFDGVLRHIEVKLKEIYSRYFKRSARYRSMLAAMLYDRERDFRKQRKVAGTAEDPADTPPLVSVSVTWILKQKTGQLPGQSPTNSYNSEQLLTAKRKNNPSYYPLAPSTSEQQIDILLRPLMLSLSSASVDLIVQHWLSPAAAPVGLFPATVLTSKGVKNLIDSLVFLEDDVRLTVHNMNNFMADAVLKQAQDHYRAYRLSLKVERLAVAVVESTVLQRQSDATAKSMAVLDIENVSISKDLERTTVEFITLPTRMYDCFHLHIPRILLSTSVDCRKSEHGGAVFSACAQIAINSDIKLCIAHNHPLYPEVVVDFHLPLLFFTLSSLSIRAVSNILNFQQIPLQHSNSSRTTLDELKLRRKSSQLTPIRKGSSSAKDKSTSSASAAVPDHRSNLALIQRLPSEVDTEQLSRNKNPACPPLIQKLDPPKLSTLLHKRTLVLRLYVGKMKEGELFSTLHDSVRLRELLERDRQRDRKDKALLTGVSTKVGDGYKEEELKKRTGVVFLMKDAEDNDFAHFYCELLEVTLAVGLFDQVLCVSMEDLVGYDFTKERSIYEKPSLQQREIFRLTPGQSKAVNRSLQLDPSKHSNSMFLGDNSTSPSSLSSSYSFSSFLSESFTVPPFLDVYTIKASSPNYVGVDRSIFADINAITAKIRKPALIWGFSQFSTSLPARRQQRSSPVMMEVEEKVSTGIAVAATLRKFEVLYALDRDTFVRAQLGPLDVQVEKISHVYLLRESYLKRNTQLIRQAKIVLPAASADLGKLLSLSLTGLNASVVAHQSDSRLEVTVNGFSLINGMTPAKDQQSVLSIESNLESPCILYKAVKVSPLSPNYIDIDEDVLVEIHAVSSFVSLQLIQSVLQLLLKLKLSDKSNESHRNGSKTTATTATAPATVSAVHPVIASSVEVRLLVRVPKVSLGLCTDEQVFVRVEALDIFNKLRHKVVKGSVKTVKLFPQNTIYSPSLESYDGGHYLETFATASMSMSPDMHHGLRKALSDSRISSAVKFGPALTWELIRNESPVLKIRASDLRYIHLGRVINEIETFELKVKTMLGDFKEMTRDPLQSTAVAPTVSDVLPTVTPLDIEIRNLVVLIPRNSYSKQCLAVGVPYATVTTSLLFGAVEKPETLQVADIASTAAAESIKDTVSVSSRSSARGPSPSLPTSTVHVNEDEYSKPLVLERFDIKLNTVDVIYHAPLQNVEAPVYMYQFPQFRSFKREQDRRVSEHPEQHKEQLHRAENKFESVSADDFDLAQVHLVHILMDKPKDAPKVNDIIHKFKQKMGVSLVGVHLLSDTAQLELIGSVTKENADEKSIVFTDMRKTKDFMTLRLNIESSKVDLDRWVIVTNPTALPASSSKAATPVDAILSAKRKHRYEAGTQTELRSNPSLHNFKLDAMALKWRNAVLKLKANRLERELRRSRSVADTPVQPLQGRSAPDSAMESLKNRSRGLFPLLASKSSIIAETFARPESSYDPSTSTSSNSAVNGRSKEAPAKAKKDAEQAMAVRVQAERREEELRKREEYICAREEEMRRKQESHAQREQDFGILKRMVADLTHKLASTENELRLSQSLIRAKAVSGELPNADQQYLIRELQNENQLRRKAEERLEEKEADYNALLRNYEFLMEILKREQLKSMEHLQQVLNS
eukprot:GILJ01017307.1.p1 GENE.GILJ01017307.1~~GILJ01017307.1.p1  ORF type:complete len:2287 (+),score=416.69 GILJ01017307.1:273-6863(+)